MEITASSVARKQFTKRQRGYDSKEVSSYLDAVGSVMATYERDLNQLAAKVEKLQERLVDAKQAEEAVKLTIIAASKAKEEMLAKAQQEADRMVDAAVMDAAAVRVESEATKAQTAEILAAAEAEAADIVASAEASALDRSAEADADARQRVNVARREALSLLEETRIDAEQLLTAALEEQSELQERLEEMRVAIDLVEKPLQAVATGALAELTTLRSLLPEPPEEPANHLEAPVDTLEALSPSLNHDFEILRDQVAQAAIADDQDGEDATSASSEMADEAAALMEIAYASEGGVSG